MSSTIHGSAVDKEMARVRVPRILNMFYLISCSLFTQDGLDMSEKDTFGGGDDFAR